MLEIETRGFDEQLAKFKRADKIMRRRFKQAMGKSIVVLTSSWRRDAPVLTGRYFKSLEGRITEGSGATQVQGFIGTNVVASKTGFPYPAALEAGGKKITYHYRAGPRAGQRTKGHVKRVVKNNTRKVTGFFKRALKLVVKDLEV